ncbi:MAG: PhaM family polyhydroxyalkanoate granule multifunctional regulatory protein [Aquabacterium sp.]
MPTRPADASDGSSPGATDRLHPFAGLGAGLDFFQDWMKAAGSALPHLQSAASAAAPGMSAWTLPTLDPEELDKRIQDLKTVQFWLEQNARMIGMTIQGLEVQRMTLTTLKGMNVSMEAVRDALKARAAAPGFGSAPKPGDAAPAPEGPAPTPDWMARARASADLGSARAEPASPPEATMPPPQATPAAEATPPGEAPPADLINPMRWWDTLTQQFTHLAHQAAASAATAAASMPTTGTPGADTARSPSRGKAGATARGATAGSGSATAAPPDAPRTGNNKAGAPARKRTTGTTSGSARPPSRRRTDTQAD